VPSTQSKLGRILQAGGGGRAAFAAIPLIVPSVATMLVR
jgi:hypothetical protein